MSKKLKSAKIVFQSTDLRLVHGVRYDSDRLEEVTLYVLEERHEDSLGEARWEAVQEFDVPPSYARSLGAATSTEFLIHRMVEAIADSKRAAERSQERQEALEAVAQATRALFASEDEEVAFPTEAEDLKAALAHLDASTLPTKAG